MPRPRITVILMPGLDGTGDLFAAFRSCLSADFDIITAQYPPTECLDYAALLPHIRDISPESAPFVLIAESFSTPLAIQFAAANPPNLRAVILCAGFTKSPVTGLRRRLLHLGASLLFRLPLTATVIKAYFVGFTASSTLIASIRSSISMVGASVLVFRLREVLSCDATLSLATMTVPLLYLQAKNDRLVGASCWQEIRSHKPDAKMIRLPGPHMLLQRHPEKAAAIINHFIQNTLDTLMQ